MTSLDYTKERRRPTYARRKLKQDQLLEEPVLSNAVQVERTG